MITLKFILPIILLLMPVTVLFTPASSTTLNITVETSKPSYYIGENIDVYGNLTYNGSPVPERLVAIEVQNPNNDTVVSRTRQTDPDGKYNLTFKLPTDAKLGIYMVYVSASYKGETATNDTTFELISAPDIAVTNVTPFKTVVGQGFSVKINVTVENQGGYTESFNVSVFYDDTIIILPDGKNYTTATLASGDSTTLTFTWNTTGVAKGNYTITAKATQLPGETDTTDNTLEDGWIIVAMVGDITGPDGWPDGKCDMRDVRKVAKLFGINYPDPEYEPNCDINNDLKIDMKDIRTVAKHFGETDP